MWYGGMVWWCGIVRLVRYAMLDMVGLVWWCGMVVWYGMVGEVQKLSQGHGNLW